MTEPMERYRPPKAGDLHLEYTENFTFRSLGVWRKIYVIICTLSFFAISLFFTLGYFFGESNEELAPLLVMFMMFSPIAYGLWIYHAVVNRKVIQLRVLSITQLIPFLNPVSAIIFWSIGSISKKESASRNLKKLE